MKIDSLTITNFRGISLVEVYGLGETIIIAGQNGSGKSCIFDAIRLLKSTYGGYQQNEWQHFFSEFSIQLGSGSADLKGLFNDNTKPTVISCEFRLRAREKAYLDEHAAELLEATIWQSVLPEAFQFGGYRKAMFSSQFRDKQPEVDQKVRDILPTFRRQLAAETIFGHLTVFQDGRFKLTDSIVLQVIFTTYRPRNIGVIDFHGAQRHYGRELVQGINLNLEATNQTHGQSAVYNYSTKYNNIKSEMAGNYIKELLAEHADPKQAGDGTSLSETLKELFESFFPDKQFLGPKPTRDGILSFPVRTSTGTEHDLDELSSGEKEILYGYLRIRSSAPQDSIILLDEPELHLNPRLIRGLPEFYRKHLSEALENQLWLVTHSDALIREAVGKPGFNVFHMLPCGSEEAGTSQLRPLAINADLDLALTDLIGDLAAYRPGGKAVLFEGGGDSEFDRTFVGALFAEELRGVNLISGTNKVRVRALHEVLEVAYAKGSFPTKFFAIVDADSDEQTEYGPAISRFSWGVYHVENFLLQPDLIAEIVNALHPKPTTTVQQVSSQLQVAAKQTVNGLVIHRLKTVANSALVGSINLQFAPDTKDIAGELARAIERSKERLMQKIDGPLVEQRLGELEAETRCRFEASLEDGSWMTKLPGREILKRYISDQNIPVAYEILRNLIMAKMIEVARKPKEMAATIGKVTAG